MRWLWLVAVGIADVQFPMWIESRPHTAPRLYRYATSSRDSRVRDVDHAVLQLLGRDLIEFPTTILPGGRELRDDALVEVIWRC